MKTIRLVPYKCFSLVVIIAKCEVRTKQGDSVRPDRVLVGSRLQM